MKLSIIVPTYCRFGRIVKVIEKLLANFPEAEIIVINDGSTDETKRIQKIFENKIVYLENSSNKGKGFSLRKGFKKASGDFLIFTDDDLPYGIEGIKQIIAGLEEGYDIVIAQRSKFYNDIFLKALARPCLYILLKILFGLRFKDTQAGLKGFTKQAGKRLWGYSISKGFAVDIEILYLAKRLKYKIKEIPLEQTRESFLVSTFNLGRIIDMFIELIKIRLHHYEL